MPEPKMIGSGGHEEVRQIPERTGEENNLPVRSPRGRLVSSGSGKALERVKTDRAKGSERSERKLLTEGEGGNLPAVIEKPGKPEKLKAVLVQAEGAIEARARDMADAAMARNKGETGILGRIWKHSVFRDYYHQKELAKARRKIQETGNLYVGEDGSDTDHKAAMEAIVDRFASEYADAEILHRGANPDENEKRRIVQDIGPRDPNDKSPQEVPAKELVRELIRAYARGDIDEKRFQEDKVRIFQRAEGKKEDITKGAEFADNLLEIAKTVKERLSHEQGLNALDFDFDLVIGKARAGVRTEAQIRGLDRLIAFTKRAPVLKYLPENTIALSAAIVYGVTGRVARGLFTSRVAAVATFGGTAALGGIFAGWRERVQLAEERRQHAREMAEGKKFDDKDAPRRKEMEKYRYNTERAEVLSGNLEASLERLRSADMTHDDITAALAHLAGVEARIQASDTKQIDLIAYGDSKTVERERFRMDVLRAQIKVELRKKIADSGYTGPVVPGGKAPSGAYNFEARLAELVGAQDQALTGGPEGIEQKDKLFNQMRRRQVAKRAIAAFGIGMVIGAGVQEIRAAFDTNLVGVFEGRGSNPTAHYSLLRSLFRGNAGDHIPAFRVPMQARELVEGAMHARLPEGFELHQAGNGTYQIFENGQLLQDNLKLDASGALDKASQDLLAKHGFAFSEVSKMVGGSVTKSVDVNPADYVNRHPNMFHHIKRDLWFDNDTPKPVFDKNELRLWWGGPGNTGLDGSGHAVFNMQHMTADGSYHTFAGAGGKLSADAQALMKSGDLRLLLSLSENTQNQVFEVPIDANGDAMVDLNSDIGKMFFREVNGKAQFIGKFAEIAQALPGKAGANEEHFRILATVVGEGRDTVPDVITVDEAHKVVTNVLEMTRPETTGPDHLIEVPPPAPIMSRTPLERAKRGEQPVNEEKVTEVPPAPPVKEGEGLGPAPAAVGELAAALGVGGALAKREKGGVPIKKAEADYAKNVMLEGLINAFLKDRATSEISKFLDEFENAYENSFVPEYRRLVGMLTTDAERTNFEDEFRRIGVDYGEARHILYGFIDPGQRDRWSVEDVRTRMERVIDLQMAMRDGLNRLRRRAENPELDRPRITAGEGPDEVIEGEIVEEDGAASSATERKAIGSGEDIVDAEIVEASTTTAPTSAEGSEPEPESGAGVPEDVWEKGDIELRGEDMWTRADEPEYHGLIEGGLKGPSLKRVRGIIKSQPMRAREMLNYFYRHEFQGARGEFRSARVDGQSQDVHIITRMNRQAAAAYRRAVEHLEELNSMSKPDRNKGGEQVNEHVNAVIGSLKAIREYAQEFRGEAKKRTAEKAK